MGDPPVWMSLLHNAFYYLCRPLLNWKQHLNSKHTLDLVSIYYLIIFFPPVVESKSKRNRDVRFCFCAVCSVQLLFEWRQSKTKHFSFTWQKKRWFSDVDMSFPPLFLPPSSSSWSVLLWLGSSSADGSPSTSCSSKETRRAGCPCGASQTPLLCSRRRQPQVQVQWLTRHSRFHREKLPICRSWRPVKAHGPRGRDLWEHRNIWVFEVCERYMVTVQWHFFQNPETSRIICES